MNCKSCGAEIVWLKTAQGNNMPVDASTVLAGEDKIFDPRHHESHFVTCPNATTHRKRKR